MHVRRAAPFAMILLLLGPEVRCADPAPPACEILVCGRRHAIGTPVVTWLDPGGYDAANLDRRFPEEAPKDAPARVKPGFGERDRTRLPEGLREKVGREGWDLEALQAVVDQFVIHYDEAGTARSCFRILHDERELGVHFLLDLDGTLYQTMDLREAAWHATKANKRSIGIEIANIGAHPPGKFAPRAARWYRPVAANETVITPPMAFEKSGLREPDLILRPGRPDPIRGEIQGQVLEQYDLTPQQYDALIRLAAALTGLFPKITPDYPRGADGTLRLTALPPADYDGYAGILGHFHVQANKVDPGPAFRWDTLIDGVRAARVPVPPGRAP